jgi:proton-coupled amino acid transporter
MAPPGKISTLSASFHLLKAVMGAGSFALPWAFLQAGYLLGPLLLVSVCALSAQMHVTLVRCRREASSRAGYGKLEIGEAGASRTLMERQSAAPLLNYQELAQSLLGAAGGRVVTACLLCASIGVCSAYVVFITENVCSVVDSGCKAAGSRLVVTIPIMTTLVLLALLRDHSRLSFTSLLGDVAILGGTVIVAAGALTQADTEQRLLSSEPLQWASPSTLPLSFGIIAFLYCTQFLTLPIEASMRHPEEYSFAVWSVFVGTAAANLCFALLCLFTWRQSVHEIVILNVASGFFTMLAKLCLCVDLLFSYPLVLFPAVEMIEGYLGRSVCEISVLLVVLACIPVLSYCSRKSTWKYKQTGGACYPQTLKRRGQEISCELPWSS